jgi:glucose/mannose-6-phosphate isomerase
MHVLDDPKTYKRLDPKNVRGSVASLALQCQEAWQGMAGVRLPSNYKGITRICINGMGGSALGGHIIRCVYDRELSVPLDVVNSYTLPGYVDRNTLLILSSYSGTTEEVLATRAEALRRKAKIFVIAQGGELIRWAKAHRLPHYTFDDSKGNPSQQPRMGLGYSVFGQIALLAKLRLIKIKASDVADVVEAITKCNVQWGVDVSYAKNPAKQLAATLQNKVLHLVAAEHLVGNTHVWANQTNETAKTLSDFRAIPELNHHLLEGLKFPRENQKLSQFLFLESNLYNEPIVRRYRITKKVIAANRVRFSSVTLGGSTRLAQSFVALALGSYVTLYQGLLGNTNPSDIRWVDYFKKELAKGK